MGTACKKKHCGTICLGRNPRGQICFPDIHFWEDAYVPFNCLIFTNRDESRLYIIQRLEMLP